MKLSLALSVSLLAAWLPGCPDDHPGPGPLDTPPPSTPALFAGGVFATGDFDWRLAFDPDGRTVYFPRSEGFFPQTRQATIMVARFEAGRWGTPEVASFSGEFPDLDPFVSPDGQTLHFSSIRPVDGEEREDSDLWLVRRLPDGGWGEPEHLGDAVNSDADELYSSVDEQGTLYFASERDGGHGGWDIYRSELGEDGSYRPAENLGAPVNSSSWEFNPTITPDGRVLLFTALNRIGGAGAGDIWVSEQVDGEWNEPVGVGDLVNTSGDEYHPSLSPTLDRLFFVTAGDIYEVDVASLTLPRLSPPFPTSGRAR